MIFLKRGVKLISKQGLQLHPVWHEYALEEIENVYSQYNSPTIITSAWDGKHKTYSAHYGGKALDFRTRIVPVDLRESLTAAIASVLGVDFDVIFEGDHLHVEYDPR